MWRNVIMFIAGLALIILGITLVFQQWGNVVAAFKAAIGPLLAVVGLVIMFAAGLNKND